MKNQIVLRIIQKPEQEVFAFYFLNKGLKNFHFVKLHYV